MKRRRVTSCRLVVGNQILRSRLHENEIYKCECYTCRKSLRRLLRQVCRIIAGVPRNFSLKTRRKKQTNKTKKQGKERKTGCFQCKVTNYVSTKTRTKRRTTPLSDKTHTRLRSRSRILGSLIRLRKILIRYCTIH